MVQRGGRYHWRNGPDQPPVGARCFVQRYLPLFFTEEPRHKCDKLRRIWKDRPERCKNYTYDGPPRPSKAGKTVRSQAEPGNEAGTL